VSHGNLATIYRYCTRRKFTVHPPVAIVVWFDCYHSFCVKSAPLHNTGHDRSVITTSRRQLHSRRRGHTQWSWNVSYTAFDVQKDDSYLYRPTKGRMVYVRLTPAALQPCSSWTELQMLNTDRSEENVEFTYWIILLMRCLSWMQLLLRLNFWVYRHVKVVDTCRYTYAQVL